MNKLLEELCSKKSFRKYKRLVRKHQRLLIKQVRHSAPFDYDALSLFVSFLRFMQEYYKAGDNVWALEDTEHNRVDILNRAIHEYDGWHDCDSESWKEYSALVSKIDFKKTELGLEFEFSDEMTALSEKIEKEKEAHWNNFCTIIKDEFLYLWD